MNIISFHLFRSVSLKLCVLKINLESEKELFLFGYISILNLGTIDIWGQIIFCLGKQEYPTKC